jgi:hypothetical protein|nr:MAG TPA: hypothetical protein [Caudoviricetes sp.]
MGHLFRAKDEAGNLVYGSVVYGKAIAAYYGEEPENTHFFVPSIEYEERWEVVFGDDDYPEDEYYDDWQVETIEIDWDTLELNVNGKWIKYEVKK